MRYKILADLYEQLEQTPKHLEKMALLSRFLEETTSEELGPVVLLLLGTVFSASEEKKTGVAEKIVCNAIALATGHKNIEEYWKKTGDLGVAAERCVQTKQQQILFSQKLMIGKVYENIRKLAALEGEGATDAKQRYIAELLTSAEPKEARYIVRTLLGDMRTGMGEGILRDALIWAYYPKIVLLTYTCIMCQRMQPLLSQCVFCKGEIIPLSPESIPLNVVHSQKEITQDTLFVVTETEKEAREIQNSFVHEVQEALDMYNDFPLIAKRAKTRTIKKLLETGLIPGKPLKLMLFQKANSIEEAFIIVGKPAACEYKYDGFRLQVHRNGDIITLFTRSLENVTAQFPDVVEIVKNYIMSHDYILDCEVVGYDKEQKKFTPFQLISQRIQRKYDVVNMAKEVPVHLVLFDLLEYNGQTMLQHPFQERRRILGTMIKAEERLLLAQQLVTENEQEAKEFYAQALQQGTEGMMMKNIQAPYKPGLRTGYGVKIKPTMETLDLVIVGGEWGEGKRAQWLSSFTLACRTDHGEYVVLGNVGTGFKEKGDGLTFSALTERLKPLIEKEHGREVIIKPTIILEIAYEEIQRSPSYSSGYALRFPRVVRLRTDKPLEECSALSYVQQLYDEQNA